MIINTQTLFANRLKAALALLAAWLVCGVGYGWADTIIKAPTGTDLTTAASWSTAVPGAGDLAEWDTHSLCTNLTLYNYESWDGMAVAGGATNIDISGWATLTLGSGGIDLSASAVNVSMGAPIQLETNQTWTVSPGTTFTMSGAISGTAGLIKAGPGTLALTGNNPMLNVLTVNGGTVFISGQIHYNEGYQQINAFTINSGGTISVSSGNEDNFLGQCNYDAKFNTLNGGTLQYQVAGGTSASTSRAYNVGPNGGTIEVLNSNATLTFNYFGAEFQFTLNTASNLVLTGAGNGLMYKSLSGVGGVVKAGPGTWLLGNANTYGGNTIVSNGTLVINGSVSGNVIVNSGAMLGGTGSIGGNLSCLPGAIPQFTEGSTVVISGSLNVNGNTVHLVLPNYLGAGTYTLAQYGTTGSSGTFSVTPVIDSGSLAGGMVAQVTTGGGLVNLVVGPPAPHLTITSINGGLNPSANIGFSVVVEALDAGGNSYALPTDTNFVLNVNSGDGTLAGTISGTISAGNSSTTLTGVTYSKAQSGVVLGVANTNGLLQPGNSSAFTVNPGPAATLTITAGNNWSDVPGVTLPNPFVVTVTDSDGNVVPGTNVTFAIASTPAGATGQSLSAFNVLTDANGQASTTLTLGSATGVYTVTASAGVLNGSPAGFTATAVNQGWREVWCDEFDYNGLPDDSKWGYESGFIRNHEAQYFTVKRIQNAEVTNGMLIITGRNENYLPPGQSAPVNYTSASLITLNKESWTYGRFETRASLPTGIGPWPAFWAMGINNPQVGWPICGEIDMLEFIGLDPGIIHGNAFWAYDVGGTTAVGAGQGIEDVPDASVAFHVYAVEWNPQQMKFYVDNSNYYTFNLSSAGVYQNTFNMPFYILVDMALGGQYNGDQLNNSILPQQFLVDYVRVYQQLPTWTGGGSDGHWSTTNNWAINEPLTGDLAVFSGATNLTPGMDSSNNLAGINFDCAAGSFVLGTPNGSVLTLTGSGINNSSSNLQTVNVPIILAASQAFSTTSANTIINGPISGNGFGLTKAGAGTLTLDGTNSFTGGTMITAGTLALGLHGCLATNSNVSISAGGTLDVSAPGSYTMNSCTPLAASGVGTIPGNSAATINAGANGNIYLNSNSITLTFDGQNPSLFISQGTLSLNGNAFVINTTNGVPLTAGTYPIIQQATGTINHIGTFPAVTGTAIGPFQSATISVVGGTVNLVMSSSVAVKINPPVVQTNGSVSFTFTGGANGVSYRFQANNGLNPANWVTLTTLLAGTNGLPGFTDPVISNHTARYYRTVTP